MKRIQRLFCAVLICLCLTLSLSACSWLDFREAFVQKTEAQTRFLLNSEYVTMMKEETFALSVSVQGAEKTPSFDVDWQTDDKEIVTVNDGVLYAVSQGVTNVHAKVSVNGETPYTKDLVCTVEVKINQVPITGLSFHDSSLDLTEGDSASLTLFFSPVNTTDTNVTWISSDTKVVSVGADGTILANRPGKANVVAVSTADDSLFAVCKVTVKENKNSRVKNVKLSSSSLKLNIGDTAKLTATVTASSFKGSVIWQSDNNEVATVSQSGEITAVSKGSTYITATAGNKSASCRVTVSGGSGSVIPCTSVQMSQTSVRLVDGSATIKLDAICLPLNTTEIGAWSSSNTDVATVTSGGVVSVKNLSKIAVPWTTTIRYTVSGSVSGACVITVVPSSKLASSILMTETQYTLAPGDTAQIVTAKDVPDSADIWVWESSDLNVVTVSDTGEIRAISDGTATVTVSSADRPNVKAVASVTVQPISVPVTLSTETGATEFTSFDDILLKLTLENPELLPEDATVILSCDNYRAVEFSIPAGTKPTETLSVWPIASGTVVFSAQIVSESNRYQFVVEPLTVTLSLPALSDFKLTEASLSLFVGEEASLAYTVSPDEYHDQIHVRYEVSNPEILSLTEDNRLTALSAGETDVTVSVLGSPELTATCHVTVSEEQTEPPQEETEQQEEETGPKEETEPDREEQGPQPEIS